MRKWLRFASLFAGNSQELQNDEREFYKEFKDALLPYTSDNQEFPADFGDLSKFGI